MTNTMVQVYYKLVKAESRNIDQVPANLRAAVQALLDADKQTQEQPAQ